MQYLTTKLEDINGITHGFFTRRGGAGKGLYDSLNCALSSKDSPEIVRANRACVAEAIHISPNNLVTVSQVHSPDVVTVTAPFAEGETPEADALVTDKPGLGLAILTADCAPVLFASADGKIIGAAHAGWKGAVTGVLETTISAMEKLGARTGEITAAIGPCIGPESYEVSKGFERPFLEQSPDNSMFFKAGREGHLFFNMPAYIARRLHLRGIKNIIDTKQDTLPAKDVYFSYRRSCLNKEPDYGRQISVIALT